MMMSKQQSLAQTPQRWYQKNKTLLDFIGKIQKMPVSLMETYCKCVIDYTVELCQTNNKKFYVQGHSNPRPSNMSLLP